MKKRNYFWISCIIALLILGSVYYLGKSDGKEHKAETTIGIK